MPADQEDSVPHWSKFSKDDGHYGIVWALRVQRP